MEKDTENNRIDQVPTDGNQMPPEAVLSESEQVKSREDGARGVGRPLKFKPEELTKKIDQYFESCFEDDWIDVYYRDENGYREKEPDGTYKKIPKKIKKQIKPVTVGGLAVHLETTRETLREYKDRPEFVDTIKKAWVFIETALENGMLDGSINPTAGIFNAKNNFGWRDKTESELYGKDGEPITTVNEIRWTVIKGEKDDN